MKLGEVAYNTKPNNNEDSADTSDKTENEADDDIVDADFEEVDEDEKK